jgi:mRNA interferase RelE/StbE
MYAIEYSKAARSALKGMPRTTARLIMEKVEALAVDPLAPNNNVKKLIRDIDCGWVIGGWFT